MTTKVTKGICFNCFAQCGIVFHTEGNKLVRMEGNPDNPFSQGFICRKSKAASEMINHPERLRYPLRREGERGEGRWKRISWDEAMDEIADRLNEAREKYGPESFIIGSGINSIIVGLNWYIAKFIHLFGSPNHLRLSHVCRMPLVLGANYTCGFSLLNPDFHDTKCVVVWGTNPDMSKPPWARDIRRAIKRGAKLVVIDPRLTALASKADIWMQIRPGTDVALALAMQNVIIQEGLYDKAFVQNWTEGFDKLREHAQSYTPEKVEQITWVPADLIRKGAQLLAENTPACIAVGDGGLVQHPTSVQIGRAVTSLLALTGSLDVPGGNIHLLSPLSRRSAMAGESDTPFGILTPEQLNKRIGIDRFGVLRAMSIHMSHPAPVWQAILEDKPYPVRALLSVGGNVVVSGENSLLVRKALNKIPFFAISGLHMTPTTEMADIVLPAAHWAERPELLENGNWLFAHDNPIEPLPECRDDRDILTDLAQRLELSGFWGSKEECLDYRLEPIKMSWEEFRQMHAYQRPVELKKYEKLGFHTPSGKVELYSETLEKLGFDPMPVHHEPPESPVSKPDLAKEYPFILITGVRNANHFLSDSQHIESMSKFYREPILEIHPEAAKRLGIEDGDWVKVETPRGAVKQKAKLFSGINANVVTAPYGFWYRHPDGWKEVNINVLTESDNLGPEVGSTSLKALLCNVRKA